LLAYSKIKGRRLLPSWIKGPFFRHIFRPLISRLGRGDIVWLHNQPYIAAALERSIRRPGAKLIYHAHDPYVPRTAQTAFKSFAAHAWVFGGGALRQRYLQLFPQWKNTYVLHNGADDRLFHPPESETRNNAVPVILYVGRLQAEKGVHILLDALRILQERKVEVLCKLIGSHFSGWNRATSYVKSIQRSSPSNADFAGYRAQTEIAQELRSADVFCCPSIWLEASPCVTFEAMASGIPIVASRVGGIPEIAAEGGFLLVEPKSAIELADALQKLIENKNLRAKVGAEGLASFRRRFTWAAVAAQYRAIVERAL
jgi:spore coat protein SA